MRGPCGGAYGKVFRAFDILRGSPEPLSLHEVMLPQGSAPNPVFTKWLTRQGG